MKHCVGATNSDITRITLCSDSCWMMLANDKTAAQLRRDHVTQLTIKQMKTTINDTLTAGRSRAFNTLNKNPTKNSRCWTLHAQLNTKCENIKEVRRGSNRGSYFQPLRCTFKIETNKLFHLYHSVPNYEYISKIRFCPQIICASGGKLSGDAHNVRVHFRTYRTTPIKRHVAWLYVKCDV